jgi:hypothetical protein
MSPSSRAQKRVTISICIGTAAGLEEEEFGRQNVNKVSASLIVVGKSREDDNGLISPIHLRISLLDLLIDASLVFLECIALKLDYLGDD